MMLPLVIFAIYIATILLSNKHTTNLIDLVPPLIDTLQTVLYLLWTAVVVSYRLLYKIAKGVCASLEPGPTLRRFQGYCYKACLNIQSERDVYERIRENMFILRELAEESEAMMSSESIARAVVKTKIGEASLSNDSSGTIPTYLRPVQTGRQQFEQQIRKEEIAAALTSQEPLTPCNRNWTFKSFMHWIERRLTGSCCGSKQEEKESPAKQSCSGWQSSVGGVSRVSSMSSVGSSLKIYASTPGDHSTTNNNLSRSCFGQDSNAVDKQWALAQHNLNLDGDGEWKLSALRSRSFRRGEGRTVTFHGAIPDSMHALESMAAHHRCSAIGELRI